MPISNTFIITLCVSGPFLALGIVFIIVAANMRRKAQASQNWPAVTAEVLSAEVHESVHESEDGPDTRSYSPRITYRYTVGGQTYQSNRYSFGASTPNRRSAEEIVASYHPGTTVSARYNPEKPSEAVLKTEARGTNVFMIVGIVLLVIGVMIGCVGGVITLLAAAGAAS